MNTELHTFMAGVRKAETGAYEDKNIPTRRNGFDGVRQTALVGSYNIPYNQWAGLAADAGLPGASWRDPSAQERVVASTFERLHRKYNDWRLVAIAWKAGEDVADAVLADPSSLQREETGDLLAYVQTVDTDSKAHNPVTEMGLDENPFRTETAVNAVDLNTTTGQNRPEDMVRNIVTTLRDRQRKQPSTIVDAEVADGNV